MEIANFSLPLAVGVLFFLLLLSAFFSGSETALTRARRSNLRVRQEHGDKGADKAEKLLSEPERMLSTILLGNNFVNIAASALATALFVAKFGEAGILYATIAMTVIVLIFAEILPKTIAVAHAESIACQVAGLLSLIQRLLSPMVKLLIAIIAMLKGLLRIPEQEETPLTHKELASMIDISAESGVLDQAREQMLNNSLTLHEVVVKALMTPRPNMQLLDGSLSVAEALRKVSKAPHSRYPVYLDEPDNLIGIVHLRDLLKLKALDVALSDALIWKTPPFIPTNKNALAQLFDFQTNHQHMAIVVDEFGDIEGLVTLEDIIEEIVGEIHDESDLPPQTEMWPQPDGSLVTAATVSLHDINQELGSDLPEDGSVTIGGLIVQILGDVPEGRLCITIADLNVEVLSVRGEWIKRVRITRNIEAVE